MHKMLRDPEKKWSLGILCIVTTGFYENAAWNVSDVTCPDCLALIGPKPDEGQKTIHIRNDAQTVDKGPIPQYAMTFCDRLYKIRNTRPMEGVGNPLLPGWEICADCLAKWEK